MTLKAILFILSIFWHHAEFTTEKTQKHGSLKIPASFEITTEINNKQIDFFHYTTDVTKQKFSNKMQARILKDQVDIFENEMAPDIIDDLSKRLIQLSHGPIAFVVDDTPKTYYDAMSYIDKLYDNLKSEFWFMKFNASGVSKVLAKTKPKYYDLKNQFEMNKIINKGATAFFAILKASQLLPEKSAIILFTSKTPIDEDVSQLTAHDLARKNIKLFVIWTGTSSEIVLLKQTALYSGGNFYYQNIEKSEEFDMKLSDESTLREVILIKNNNINKEMFRIPIDRSIKNLDVMIDGSIKSATLVSPTGYIADLLNITSLQRLSPGSHVTHAPECCHTTIRFNTAKVISMPVIGIWKLRVNTQSNENNNNEFNLTVSAETDLSVLSELNHNSPGKKRFIFGLNERSVVTKNRRGLVG